MAKDAAALLKDYGYVELGDGLLSVKGELLYIPARTSSERWEKTDGGWHCYGIAARPFGGGEPWGRPMGGDLVQVPYTQTEAFANVSGLHPARNPEAFEWVWPEERLVEIYEHATPLGADSQAWRKEETEDGHKYVKA